MKNIILLLLVLLTGISYAEETQELEPVHLNLDSEIQKINTEKEIINTDKLEFQHFNNSDEANFKKDNDPDLYSKKTSTFKKEKKINDKMSVGAKYDTTIAPESLSQTRTLYSNYDITDKMTVNASYKNNTSNVLSDQTKGTISVAPEYKVNKHVSLKNILGRNIGDKSNKTELQLNVQPFQDDRMDLSVGAGQVQRDNNGASSSQINFGTNIRF